MYRKIETFECFSMPRIYIIWKNTYISLKQLSSPTFIIINNNMLVGIKIFYGL